MYVHELTWMCQVISEEEAEQRANDVEEGKRETRPLDGHYFIPLRKHE